MMEKMGWILLLCGVLMTQPTWGLPREPDGSIPITIGGLIGIDSEDNGWSGAGLLPAMQLALTDINNRSDVLPGYTLKLEYLDSMCNPGLSAASLVRLMQRPPVKVMIAGETCSYATVSVAQMGHYFNLMQVTPTSNSPELAERKRFKTLFRLNLVYHKSLYPIAWICRYFGWTHVAVVRQNIAYFTATANFLEPHLRDQNITILAAEAVSTEPPVSQVANLKRKDVRIIIYLGYEGPLRALFCEAYKNGMYGPLYQWFATSYFQEGWLDKEDTPCTPKQLKEVANLTLGTLPTLKDLSDKRTVSGRTYEEYEKVYREMPKQYDYNSYHTYGYDTIWTIALGLNNSIKQIHSQNISDTCNGTNFTRPKTLADFTYDDDEMAQVFFQEMSNLKYHGVTGDISFDEDGGRIADVTQIVQLQLNQGDLFVRVGYYFEGQHKVDFNATNQLLWRGDGPPFDIIQLRIIKVHLSPILLIVVAILAGCGVIFAVSFLTFNFIYRNRKCIKMSSPRINNVIGAGCILAYVAMVVNVLDGRWVAQAMLPYLMCTASTALLMVAFTLAFGAMFVKTWRVYSIFKEKTGISNKPMHDHQLLAFVGLLLLIDATVLLAWSITDPPFLVHHNGTKTESQQFADLEQVDACHSNHAIYWSSAILVWKGLFLLAGCFLAFETRNVHIPALNDSRHIGFSVYNTIVMCVLGLTVNLALGGQRSLGVSFIVGAVFITATFTLLILFLPKIRDIQNDIPQQPNQRPKATPSSSFDAGGVSPAAGSASVTFLHSMDNLNKQLDKKLDMQRNIEAVRLEQDDAAPNRTIEKHPNKQQQTNGTNEHRKPVKNGTAVKATENSLHLHTKSQGIPRKSSENCINRTSSTYIKKVDEDAELPASTLTIPTNDKMPLCKMDSGIDLSPRKNSVTEVAERAVAMGEITRL